MRRRSAARASRERVKAFSFVKSCWRAASHSCCETIGGVFIEADILVLLCSVIWAEQIRSEEISDLAETNRQDSSRGSRSGDRGCRVGDAYWTHMFLLDF